jgi:hypothetical protein
MASRYLSKIAAGGSLAVLVGVASTASAQTDESRASARAAATEGLHALQEGRYKDALDLCTRAESLMHAPTHLLLIARAQTKLGHLVAAQEAYIKIQRERLAPNAPRAFADAQAAAADEQGALAPRVPTLKVAVDGGANDVQVTLDGAPFPAALIGIASPIDPGSHTLEAKSPSAVADPVTVSIAEGAKETATLAMKAVAAPEPLASAPPAPEEPAAPSPESSHTSSRTGVRVAGWIGIGIGVVGLAGGTVFVIKNHSDRNDANAFCGANGCPESKRTEIGSLDHSADQAATASWIAYGVGAAGLVAGAVLLWVGHGKPATVRSGQVVPWFGGPRAMGVRVAF